MYLIDNLNQYLTIHDLIIVDSAAWTNFQILFLVTHFGGKNIDDGYSNWKSPWATNFTWWYFTAFFSMSYWDLSLVSAESVKLNVRTRVGRTWTRVRTKQTRTRTQDFLRLWTRVRTRTRTPKKSDSRTSLRTRVSDQLWSGHKNDLFWIW